jgi:hypothetical protein
MVIPPLLRDVCRSNIKFSRALADDSPYAAREALGAEDACTLARELRRTTARRQRTLSAPSEGAPPASAPRVGCPGRDPR